MKTIFTTSKIINIIALLFLVLGGYGLAITGFSQVLAATLYLIAFPKNKLIYSYFALVIIFFAFWDRTFNWFFTLPILLIFYLTYIIHFQKKFN
ncbi:hypothetical protein [Flavobacterium columnare]|uniref:Uncharacterized protein n=1 Tax=Flavobacterium columnare TaxID=996 RepID=A0AA94JNJ8_9FLAO|nr:hypothetical protein [Flavobacterium columnare]MCH4829162.1 hypothetical protein [Flavobacterium columnare]MCH4833939.1 hypothetical protein [Flavobacterium columnare]